MNRRLSVASRTWKNHKRRKAASVLMILKLVEHRKAHKANIQHKAQCLLEDVGQLLAVQGHKANYATS